MNDTKVIITLEGGVLTSISSTEKLHVIVVDRDIEDVNENELSIEDELKNFSDGNIFIDINYTYRLSDKDLNLNFK
jgi:hypothetical protein